MSVLNARFAVSTLPWDVGTLSSWNWNAVCPHSSVGSEQLALEPPRTYSGGHNCASSVTEPSVLYDQGPGPTLTHDVFSISLATSTW